MKRVELRAQGCLASLLLFLSVASLAARPCPTAPPPLEPADCSAPGCGFAFHPVAFSPSSVLPGAGGGRYPNDTAKTFYCDAPWRVSSLDDVIPVYFQIEGTDADAVNEMQCVALYDVSCGAVPPAPQEDIWGNYQYTPDAPSQVYKAECGGCYLSRSETGMYFLTVDTFRNDGGDGGTQADGTPLTARALGYGESDLGSFITLTVRMIYEESANWTDIHDQDLRIYLGCGPLPSLPDWHLGDTHAHSWSSYYAFEMGASGAAMFRSLQAAGLDWALVTDHAFGMDDDKWQTVGDECAAGTVPGSFAALRGEECDDGYTLGDAHHLLAFDLTDWIETYSTSPPYLSTISGICDQGGFVYGAHSSTDGWLWSDQEVREALASPCFRGLQDYNMRNTHSSSDTLHPWGDPPHLGAWDSVDTAWDADLVAGLARWDRLLSEQLGLARPEVFFLGGTDSHGSMNYHVDWNLSGSGGVLYSVFSDALGKVRNAVYLPEGLDRPNLLTALRAGRVVVTDGPVVVQGISLAGAATTYGDCDGKIGDTLSLPRNHPGARLFLQWSSSPDYGPVRAIQVLRGDSATGAAPVVVHQFVPSAGLAGTEVSVPVASLVEDRHADGDTAPDVYLRTVAYTYDPATGPDGPGDVSEPGYDPMTEAYQYRAFTNPIWLDVQPALGPGEVSGPGSGAPLQVNRADGAGSVELVFEERPYADAYNIYQGEIGAWDSLGSAAGCGAPVEPLSGGLLKSTLTPTALNGYFLVTATNAVEEGTTGSLGLDALRGCAPPPSP